MIRKIFEAIVLTAVACGIIALLFGTSIYLWVISDCTTNPTFMRFLACMPILFMTLAISLAASQDGKKRN